MPGGLNVPVFRRLIGFARNLFLDVPVEKLFRREDSLLHPAQTIQQRPRKDRVIAATAIRHRLVAAARHQDARSPTAHLFQIPLALRRRAQAKIRRARQRPRITTVGDDQDVARGYGFNGCRDIVGNDPVGWTARPRIGRQPIRFARLFVEMSMSGVINQ